MSLTSILAAVALITILVFIHEFGHFCVAKLCGVNVTVFSFGFGRRLFGVRWRGTDYRVSALPFGGYVWMQGADPFSYNDDGSDAGDSSRSLSNRPVWQRFLVMLAGPAFNLILPVVVFTTLLVAGEPQPASVIGYVDPRGLAAQAGVVAGDRVVTVDGVAVTTWMHMATLLTAHTGNISLEVDGPQGDRTVVVSLPKTSEKTGLGLGHSRADAVVGVASPASPAGKAGLRSGDRLTAVDGATVGSWTEVSTALAAAGDQVEVSATRGDEVVHVTLHKDPAWDPAALGLPATPELSWGLESGFLYIGQIMDTLVEEDRGLFSGLRPEAPGPPSPARTGGLEVGDRLLSLNGTPVLSWQDVTTQVRATRVGEGTATTTRPLQVELVRDGVVMQRTIQPSIGQLTDELGGVEQIPLLGVVPYSSRVDGEMTRVYYALPDAFSEAVQETWRLGGQVLAVLGKLVTGEAAVERTLGGPVEMFRQASSAAERGLFDWARLLGMLSISLGVVNLLPVPLLDGGQILFHAVEGIRGRPLSHALRERVQQVGLLFLVLLMLTVLVFDIRRLIDG